MSGSIELRNKDNHQKKTYAYKTDRFLEVDRICMFKLEGGVDDILHSLLKLTGWNKKEINDKVIECFSQYNINADALRMIYIFKKAGQLTFLNKKFLQRNKEVDIIKAFAPLLKPVTPAYDKLLKDLYYVNEGIDGVSIGPGEILLTMFTNAQKRKVNNADLFLPGVGSVEVKGSGGRLGKSGYARNIMTSNSLEKILNKYGRSLNDAIMSDSCRALKEWDTETNIGRIKKAIRANKISGEDGSQIIETISNGMYDIRESWDVIEIITDLRRLSDTLKKELEARHNHIETIHNISFDRFTYDWNWRLKVEKFFLYNHQLPYETYIDSLLELRTDDFKNNIMKKQFREGLKTIFTVHAYKNFMKRGRTKEAKETLTRVIMSIQLASYALYSNFDYLLCMNKQNLKSTIIDTRNKDNAGHLVQDIFKQVFNSPLKISPFSVDSRNHGVGITPNISD